MKCVDIKSSHLKQHITIQSSTSSVDEYGMEHRGWTDKFTKRGIIKNSSYKKLEVLAAQGINNFDVKDLIIRFCEVGHGDRVLYKGQPYRIIGIENLEEKNKFLLISMESLDG